MRAPRQQLRQGRVDERYALRLAATEYNVAGNLGDDTVDLTLLPTTYRNFGHADRPVRRLPKRG